MAGLSMSKFNPCGDQKHTPAILIAYLLTIFINGFPAALLLKTPDLEVLLPVVTAGQIGPEYEPELIKTQTVIARSNLYRKLENNIDIREILREEEKVFLYISRFFILWLCL